MCWNNMPLSVTVQEQVLWQQRPWEGHYKSPLPWWQYLVSHHAFQIPRNVLQCVQNLSVPKNNTDYTHTYLKILRLNQQKIYSLKFSFSVKLWEFSDNYIKHLTCCICDHFLQHWCTCNSYPAVTMALKPLQEGRYVTGRQGWQLSRIGYRGSMLLLIHQNSKCKKLFEY